MLSHLLNVINVFWPGLAVSPLGEEGGRKGPQLSQPCSSACSGAGSGPEDVLWCLQGMFTQLERPEGSLTLWTWHLSCTGVFREAFLFSSCLAGKEREEENSSYPWDVEIGRNT